MNKIIEHTVTAGCVLALIAMTTALLIGWFG